MSYPTRKDLFDKWYKAMVAGATVGKPNYSPAKKANKGGKRPMHPGRMLRKRRLRQLRKKRRMMHG